MGSYIPSTQAEREEMLSFIGLDSVEQLYADVPEQVKLKKLDLPDGLSELEVRRKMQAIADKNRVFKSIFRGAGAYNHYIPAIVKTVTSKEEFVTAYTPYQAEISQGVLQSIFEYQTMMCELTGMDASNASVYDGASAAAEAVAMCRDRKRTVAYISATVHPDVIKTVKTYCHGAGAEVIVVPSKDGVTDLDALKAALGDSAACVLVQQPNYNGLLENAAAIAEAAHSAGAKYIISANPISLGILKTPAEYGADIAVGDGQPLGMPLSFGGPYLGFITCTAAMMRKLPGRIVGETVDADGERAYVLTLQAREQHIRREKASSNICSNQALCALTAAVYLSAMGADGVARVAEQSMSKAACLAAKLTEIDGFSLKYDGEFFNEFVTTCPIAPDELAAALADKGILGGLPVDGGILWCATEMNSKEDIDELVKIIGEVCGK